MGILFVFSYKICIKIIIRRLSSRFSREKTTPRQLSIRISNFHGGTNSCSFLSVTKIHKICLVEFF